MDQQSTKVFQQSLCESRSIVDNLDPVSARMISELQKQLAKVRGNLQLEKQRCRHMAGDHLAEMKRLREESERRLDHSLRALELRKDQERMAEVKRVEDNLLRQKEQEIRLLLKQKSEDEKELRRKLQRQNEESLRYALQQERKLILEELQAKMPDEEAIAARESKLAKEVFSLGEENMKLEEQVQNLMHENRGQIEIMRRMKREQESEVNSLLRQNKSEAARDMAKLRLAENLMHQKHQDLVEVSQQATAIELERDDLLEEVTALKSLLSSTEKDRDKEKERSAKEAGESARKMGPIQKRLDDLEGQIRKLEDDKAELKMENASLRKKLTQGGDPEAKANKDLEDRIKRLRKRNAELVAMTKNLDERCKVLKTESDRVHSKQVMETSEVEMQLKKTLSRQHAKDISEYTRQIHLRDKELQELKRKLSKYEVSSSARHESAIELDRKLKALAMEKLRMEKMISKLCSQLPDFTEVELCRGDFVSELTRMQELTEENTKLRSQLLELQQPSEVDSSSLVDSGQQSRSMSPELDSLREENRRLMVQLDEMIKGEPENVRLKEEVSELKVACSSSDRRIRLLQDELEQARMMTQEFDRVQDHCAELEREVSETRGLLNDKDRKISEQALEANTLIATIQEKEAEIERVKEQEMSLKNELSQSEDLVKELQQTVEELQQIPDKSNMSMQTSPLVSPKTSPKAVQTSPKQSPAVVHKETTDSSPLLQEIVEEETEVNFAQVREHSTVGRRRTVSESSAGNLQSELAAVGLIISDPYDSEAVDTASELDKTVSTVSVETNATRSGVSVHISPHIPPSPREAFVDDKAPVVDTRQADSSPLESSDSSSSLSLLGPVSLFIACENYDPKTMSPNSNPLEELVLQRGDYVYVYGEMDDDGFYHGRLVDGQRGLVPSNYVEKLSDDPFPMHPKRQRSTSSPIPAVILPPSNLELVQQFVEDDTYSLALEWVPPNPLPPDALGYNVYTNNVLESQVDGAAVSSVLLTHIPRNQYICISVRTLTTSGESSDPQKPVEINPHFPSAPSNVQLQLVTKGSPSSVRLSWDVPSTQRKTGNVVSIVSYSIFLNHDLLVKTVPVTELVHYEEDENRVSVELTKEDFAGIGERSVNHGSGECVLSIRSCEEYYTSEHSPVVVIPSDAVQELLPASSRQGFSLLTSSGSLGQSFGRTKGSTSTPPVMTNGISGDCSDAPNHTDSAGAGEEDEVDSDDEDVPEEIMEVIPGDYYRALYSYNPTINSPNQDAGVEEELNFEEDDIIIAQGPLDDDGFFLGRLVTSPNFGLVPKNMVEHITDLTELQDGYSNKRQDLHLDSPDGLVMNGEMEKVVEALYDYNPTEQSPNENPEDELKFQQGEFITVFGEPDEDGFYEGELKGQRGLVPKVFVKPVSSALVSRGSGIHNLSSIPAYLLESSGES